MYGPPVGRVLDFRSDAPAQSNQHAYFQLPTSAMTCTCRRRLPPHGLHISNSRLWHNCTTTTTRPRDPYRIVRILKAEYAQRRAIPSLVVMPLAQPSPNQESTDLSHVHCIPCQPARHTVWQIEKHILRKWTTRRKLSGHQARHRHALNQPMLDWKYFACCGDVVQERMAKKRGCHA